MKAFATNLCNNILKRGRKEKITISPMKLQRIMYYICRDYVVETGQMPISEQFEVWKYGPVLSSVHAKFRGFGPNPITRYSKDAKGHSFQVSEQDNPLLAKVIETVWEKHKFKTAIELSKITRQPNSGWYMAFVKGNEKISIEDMRNDKTG